MLHIGHSEERLVREVLERITGIRRDQDGNPRVNRPKQQGTLHEDNTPHLASMCLSGLFPKYKGDPFVGARAMDIPFADHLRHLITFDDRPQGETDNTALRVIARSGNGSRQITSAEFSCVRTRSSWSRRWSR